MGMGSRHSMRRQGASLDADGPICMSCAYMSSMSCEAWKSGDIQCVAVLKLSSGVGHALCKWSERRRGLQSSMPPSQHYGSVLQIFAHSLCPPFNHTPPAYPLLQMLKIFIMHTPHSGSLFLPATRAPPPAPRCSLFPSCEHTPHHAHSLIITPFTPCDTPFPFPLSLRSSPPATCRSPSLVLDAVS